MDDIEQTLNNAHDAFNVQSYRERDPIEFPHRYESQPNQEIVALLASSMAYGRIDVFKPAIEGILDILGGDPFKRLSGNFESIEEDLQGFSYRMTKGPDVVDLLWACKGVIECHGSLEQCYLSHTGGDTSHIDAMASFVYELRGGRKRLNLERGYKYLLPDPEKGSACKRINLFFRWVCRDDDIDLGIWNSPSPQDLIIPLDTHVHNIARKLGLTDRKSNGMRTAQEITESLKSYNAEDPIRYDFALCHIGVSDDVEQWLPSE